MSRLIDRDRQLLEALRRGEPTAAERLVASYADCAYRLAIGVTGNAQDAEEVVQDAFWTVVRAIDTFKGDAAFGSWFYRIVADAADDKHRLRRGARAQAPLDDVSLLYGQHGAPIVDWSGRMQDPALQTALRNALTGAIAELPADYRIVLFLRDVEGLSSHEISDALGISVADVKRGAHRARLFLRKRLGEYLSGEPAFEGVPASA